MRNENERSNKKSYYAGIDLGGTFIKCGIVDSDGKLLIKDKIPTNKARPFEELVKDMAGLVSELEKKACVKLKSVGVGSPGTVDSKTGVVVYCGNLGFHKVPLGRELQKLLNLPIYVTNDANAAALGESFIGAGKKYKDMILVTLGTGVGGGIIIDGKLFEGNRSAGTEVGHIVICKDGEQCTCGRRGCFETYASATALVRQAKKAMEADRESVLWKLCGGNIDALDGKMFFDAVELCDKTAKKVLRSYTDYLAEGIVNLANVFRPQIVLIGGGISAAGDLLLNPLRRKVSRLLFGGNKYAHVELKIASLGNDAGILGCAKLAMSNE